MWVIVNYDVQYELKNVIGPFRSSRGAISYGNRTELDTWDVVELDLPDLPS